jgi:hypothetical protein
MAISQLWSAVIGVMPQKNNKPNYWGDDVTSFFRMSLYLCNTVLILTLYLFYLDVGKIINYAFDLY